MSRYIDADKLMETLGIKASCDDCEFEQYAFCTKGSDFVNVCEAISEAPSADVTEVIRCKDCKHRYIENMVWACPFGLSGGEMFYCAYGAERRTDE